MWKRVRSEKGVYYLFNPMALLPWLYLGRRISAPTHTMDFDSARLLLMHISLVGISDTFCNVYPNPTTDVNRGGFGTQSGPS